MKRTVDAETDTDQLVWRGRMLIIAAAVLWSTSGLFAKAPWFEQWPEESRGVLLAFFRSLFACLILAPLVRRPEFRRQMIPMCIAFAVMVWSFMAAMVYGPAANAIWLQYLSPAWVLLGTIVWLKEAPTRADFQMFGFCLAGVSLMVWMELSQGGTLLATSLAILSGISFAIVVLSIRTMADVDSAWLITLNHGTTALLLLPWVWTSHRVIGVHAYVALAAFGVLQMSVPYIMFARGLRRVTGAEASMLTLIEPILVPVWVYLAWHHHPSYASPRWWTYAGGGLILLGLLRRYSPAVIAKMRPRRRQIHPN